MSFAKSVKTLTNSSLSELFEGIGSGKSSKVEINEEEDELQTESVPTIELSDISENVATIIAEIDASFNARFAVLYQLLSVSSTQRLTVKVFASESNPPTVPSIVSIWSSADWFEREAFDLMGIHFEGHPDLRRILTDYGFIGHPFRKDFPTNGNLEVVYDEEKGEVVYQPVSISTRPSVPRVIRDQDD